MKHLFLESMENSEQFVENLGEWVNVSKVGKNQDPPVQKKEKAEKEDAEPKEGKVEKELTMEEWALTL